MKAHVFYVECQLRYFSMWWADDGDYILIEYEPIPHETGDPENGPSIAIDHEPALVLTGFGGPPSDERANQIVAEFIYLSQAPEVLQ